MFQVRAEVRAGLLELGKPERRAVRDTSPVTVGGTITGVDENIRVSVHTVSARLPVGALLLPAPAGGTRSPWSASIDILAAPGQVITIAAATGGHVASVERFAVTGARVG